MHTIDDESHPQSARHGDDVTLWHFRLYVAGHSPRSVAALANLQSLCSSYLTDRHNIEVFDLSIQPELAEQDNVIVLPTLVRISPQPTLKIMGDLSDTQQTLKALGLGSQAPAPHE